MNKPAPHLLSLLLLLAAATGPAWADGVVLSSTAPGMTVGRVLADDESLRLPEATITTVLMATGQVVTVNGPYDGRLVQPAEGKGGAGFTVLGDWRGVDLSSLGGTRTPFAPGLAAAIDPAAAVTVDAARPGTYCLGPATPLRLAAPENGAGTVLLQDKDSGAQASLSWPPNVGEVPWPDALPIRDGATVLARWNDSLPGNPLRFHVADDPGEAGLSRLIRWSLAGCHGQTAPYLRSLGTGIAPFALSLSSDRGRTPRYAIGETVTLVLQANRPADLYCYILRNNGIAPLFPGQPGYLAIPDHTEIRIPGEYAAVQIAAAPPPGLGEVRCYAVEQGAAAAPAIDLDAAIAAKPGEMGQALDRQFSALPDSHVAREHILLRID